jgi:hypothetical protein
MKKLKKDGEVRAAYSVILREAKNLGELGRWIPAFAGMTMGSLVYFLYFDII